MTIRCATIQDSNSLSSVVLEASLSVKDVDFTDEGWALLENTNTPTSFKKRFDSEDYFAFVYEIDSEIVGYLAMIKNEKIDHMFVLPKYRKKGICKKLWTVAKKACFENGNTGYFWVRSSSYAKAIYGSFGFRPKGERKSLNGISFQFMELNCKN